MKLSDLRRRLAELDHLPDETIVVLAKDGEGNRFSPLSEVEQSMYLADSTHSGEHYPTEADRLAMDDPDEYDEAPDEAVPAVFLWPIN